MYKFAKDNGDIVEMVYEKDDALSIEEVRAELVSALQTFHAPFTCTPIGSETNEIYNIHVDDSRVGDFIISIKEITPGGRKALMDEQRIQQKAKFMKYAYKQAVDGKKTFLMGVYRREKNTVFCVWRIGNPNTADEMPISKQIKIYTIAEAMKEGFAQQKKGNNDYAFAFRKELFSKWFLKLSDVCLIKEFNKIEQGEELIELFVDQDEAHVEMNIEDKALTLVDFEIIKQKIRTLKPKKTTPKKDDYRRALENKMAFGRAGERLVLKHEQNKLNNLSIDKLVQWTSEYDDTKGYDILSYDDVGDEMHIEVKTSALDDTQMKFYLTKNEHNRLHMDPSYYLYYVFDIKTPNPKLHIVDIEKIKSGELVLETELYSAHWDVIKKRKHSEQMLNRKIP